MKGRGRVRMVGPLGPQFAVLQSSRHCLNAGRRSPREAEAREMKSAAAITAYSTRRMVACPEI